MEILIKIQCNFSININNRFKRIRWLCTLKNKYKNVNLKNKLIILYILQRGIYFEKLS